MIDIATNELNKYYGANHVLKGVSLEIYSGEKVGLLGENGSGKTTLFKVITGEEPFESGTVSKASGKKAEILAQIPVFAENDTAEDVLRSSFAEINEIYRAMNKIEGDPALLNRYGNLMDEYERLGGYDTEVSLDKVCSGMNIDGSLRASLFNRLSGGEKSRVNLARILLRQCDILLLDEPTNHLDLPSLEWLEGFIREFPGTAVIISHDRMFLDKTVTRIIEIENGKANFYSGSYSWYIEEKQRRYAAQSEQYERQKKEIKRIEDRAKWFVEQNRFTTKHHAILSRIDHMEKIEKPVESRKVKGGFNSGGHTSKEIVSFENIYKSYGEKNILQNLNIKLFGNERVALYGANGCGKSTLLKIIIGEEQSDRGVLKISPGAEIGYMPQIITFGNPDASVIEILRSQTGYTTEKARSVLARYNFTADAFLKKAASLSGGEKSRLKLCLLMQKNIGFLLLDEPTNHLDTASREWIENALEDFNGTMLFVSHDRYFLNRFTDRVWSMENGEVTRYECGFEEFSQSFGKKDTLKSKNKKSKSQILP